jgi:hypothetical protein
MTTMIISKHSHGGIGEVGSVGELGLGQQVEET